MANKGDSKEPDVRAKLVGCEVNKGGEKGVSPRVLCLDSAIRSQEDDFTTVGTGADLDHDEQKLADHFELKMRGRIAEGCAGPNEMRIIY